MSDTIRFEGNDALEQAFASFMDQGVGDVDMNPVFPEGTYLFKFEDFTRATHADKLYSSILSPKMVNTAQAKGEEAKPLGFINLHMKVETVISTTHENPSSMQGRYYVEQIMFSERSLPQLIHIAAGILGVPWKDLQADPSMAGTKLPELVDSFARQELVAKVIHKDRRGRDEPDVLFDYSAKTGVLTNMAGYQAAVAAAAA